MQRVRLRVAAESSEQREARLQQVRTAQRERTAQHERRAAESAEQRAAQLQQMSIAERERQAAVSAEQRATTDDHHPE